MIRKLLIANRGEVVCRIGRTCRRLGIQAATVHSTADRNSLHVREIGELIEIGPAPSAQSYLNIEAVLAAAKTVGADAIHPGIGFLSEDPAFAEAVAAHGLVFVGPEADSLRRFGDKWSAKAEARRVGIPVIGGSEGSSADPAEVERIIREDLQLPVVLKAAAGGGGKGVRIVRDLGELGDSIQAAMREARSSFGRPDLIVEELIEFARHVEVQVVGDGKGDAIHLLERECSLQRRFQKVVEEAPAIGLSEELRQRLTADAVKLAKSVRYKNLGTVEFLVTDRSHYFLECNPRLQVEHTVTEEITGLDLVELQLRIAVDGALPISQSEVSGQGHAIQLRIYAEDARANFAPSSGRLTSVHFPRDVRIETGVTKGSDITPFYDPMIAKLIASAPTRDMALDRCLTALNGTFIAGVETNVAFLRQLLAHPTVRAGTADNRFIDRELDALNFQTPADSEHVGMAAAVLWRQRTQNPALGLWSGGGYLAGWSYHDGGQPSGPPAFFLRSIDNQLWKVVLGTMNAGPISQFSINEIPVSLALSTDHAGRHTVSMGNKVITFAADVALDSVSIQGPFGFHAFGIVPFLNIGSSASSRDGKLLAPMMGTILKVSARVGDNVKMSDVLVVEESMKMEMPLVAPMDAIVIAVRCVEGDVVERNQCLIELEAIQGAEA